MEQKELRRIYRVIDMMTTMHSILRGRYRFFSLSVDLLILFCSVILCATVFLDPEILKILNISPASTKVVRGITSILVFLLSLVQLRVNWKGKGELFDRSLETLCKLKSECGLLLETTNTSEEEILRQCKNYNDTLAVLPKIQDRLFPKLKAKHKRKVELSKYIDKRPESPYWLTRLLFEFKTTFKKYNVTPQEKEE
jgi:hypothetical protein